MSFDIFDVAFDDEEEQDIFDIASEDDVQTQPQTQEQPKRRQDYAGPRADSLPALLGFGDKDNPQYEEYASTPVLKSLVRGVGNKIADYAVYSQQGPQEGSLPYFLREMLGYSNDPVENQYAWVDKLREILPQESDLMPLRFIERASGNIADPASLLFGAPGAAASGLSSVTGQGLKELGFSEKAQQVGEFLTPIGAAAVGAVRGGTKSNVPRSAERVGGPIAKSEILVRKPEVEAKLQNIGKNFLDDFQKQTDIKAKPFKRGEFNAREVSNELGNLAVQDNLNKINPKSRTNQEFGSYLQEKIDGNFDKAEAIYAPKYKQANEVAKTIKTTNEKDVKNILDLKKKIGRFKTKPEKYQKVLDVLNDVSEDLGFSVKKSKEGITILDSSGNPITPKSKFKEVPLSDKMEVSRRLNKIINYDIDEKSIQDILKTVNKGLKNEIQNTLSNKNPRAAKLWKEAEKEFGNTAELYGSDSIRKLRKLEGTERASQIIKSPSALEQLSKVLSPEEFSAVERQVLQLVDDMGYKQAKKTVKELKPHLTKDGVTAADNILTYKDPLSFKGKMEKYSAAVLEDLQKSLTAGERPETTLKLMQNKEGYQTVKDTLNQTEKGKQSLEYLQKQYIDDMFAGAIDSEGEINFNKFQNLLEENPSSRQIYTDLMGPDSIKQLEKIQNYSKNFLKNVEKFGPKQMTQGKSIAVNAAKQGVFPLIAYVASGFPLAASALTAQQLGKIGVYMARRLISSPTARKALKSLATPSNWKKGDQQKLANTIMREVAKEGKDKD